MTYNRANARTFAAIFVAALEQDLFDLAADPADPGFDDYLAGLKASLANPEEAARAVGEYRRQKSGN